MKLVFVAVAAAAALCASEPVMKKDAAALRQNRPGAIPAGAVESEPGTFHYTDAQGKKWIYRPTPFGVAHWEDKPVDEKTAAKTEDEFAHVKITEQDDVVKFERPSPFGTYRWEKKKSELDEKEQAALRKAQESSQQDR
jgi:hypothetical protein